MKNFRHLCHGLVLALLSLGMIQPALATGWSVTELHVQYGNLDVPSFEGGGHSDHLIYTLQHAHGWKYGDNFFFIDVLDARSSGFQDFDLYGEWYSNFSLGKLAGKKLGAGVVSDIGFILGFNWARDAEVKKYLPGIRLALDIEGFAFANLDITAYIDDNQGVSSGGAPKEDDSYMIDFNFARPFSIGAFNFSIEGHIEYIGERDNEFGDRVESWLLAQPQFRWSPNDHVSLGIEYQYWMNKLGDRDTDENTVQALFVWKF
ncbi:MAG: nucleoside-binding protein [Gammaproteobacteria bacterium]|nr:nucleoside-binding protein [Gammaproteobacteria bacterium]